MQKQKGSEQDTPDISPNSASFQGFSNYRLSLRSLDQQMGYNRIEASGNAFRLKRVYNFMELWFQV